MQERALTPPGGRPPAALPLHAHGLTRRFGDVTALAAVDLCVRPGAVVGLVGPNGCGKTTALHAVAGLVRLDAGRALVAGHPAGTTSARRCLALVPDEPGGLEELTVEEHVRLVHALHDAGDPARRRAETLLAGFGLDVRRRTPLRALSRGLRRQASIVAAFSLAPPLVVVDEATATLDPEAVVALREAIAALARRRCGVLLATQDLHFAERACDEVVLLRGGRVVASGSVGEVRRRHDAPSLEEAFLRAVGHPALAERMRSGLGAL